ncbi:hypothetical protein [Streptomyces sp. NPDC001068]|uniref:hypothetical protein n=1 Tax=Streptomyces sp. NPDC001068 TaxID=3364544 RepID=UPI0036B30E39
MSDSRPATADEPRLGLGRRPRRRFPRRVLLTLPLALAGPELADMQPLLDELAADTGVRLDMSYEATADPGTQAGRTSYDLAWPVSDRSFLLRLQASGKSAARPESTSVMRSPVVVGVTPAVAERLREGVPGGRLTWADIADAAARGTVRFGMADPRRSETGRRPGTGRRRHRGPYGRRRTLLPFRGVQGDPWLPLTASGGTRGGGRGPSCGR